MEQYDSFLTRFKKDLWNQCIQQRIFDYIPEDKLERVKEVFENTVRNYQTQILQHDGQGDEQSLYPILIQTITRDVTPLKQVSRDTILQQNKEVFDQKVEAKQKEFNTMMHKDAPPTPQFGDEATDEPLDKENLDQLIQTQMKERESVMNLNVGDTQNTVVATNSFSPLSPLNAPDAPLPQPQPREPQWTKIEEQLKLQSTILQQIVQSQIAILKKIK